MKICRPYKKLLLAEIHGTLNEEERERLQDHLGECPACRREWRRLQQLMQGISRTVPPPQPQPEDIRKTATTVRRRLNRSRGERAGRLSFLSRRRLGISLALAAACLLLLFGLTTRTGRDSRPGQTRLAERKNRLPSKDFKVIENLELLEDMDIVRKLVIITDGDAAESSAKKNHG